ncbi:3543_t:CDS:2 [Dentiscutata erythropus]|uniref:3543_t:CDS:1 n=1 Tax=Dentiscutata erythropus TaxID=1348616 RepID=A0A9N9J753_9GLOM|nr:3543_t:CDS:2 [Dentiscutata erythropus]
MGSNIHISNLVCEFIEYLKLSNYKIAINNLLSNSIYLKYTEAGVAIYSGINHNSWRTCDNISSNYGLFAKDALLVLQIDMKNSTKKPLLCAGKYRNSSKHVMIYRDSNSVKRLKRIR